MSEEFTKYWNYRKAHNGDVRYETKEDRKKRYAFERALMYFLEEEWEF